MGVAGLAMALSAPGMGKKVAPAQLSEIVEKAHGDKELAKRLVAMELTARVPAEQVSGLAGRCPGGASRRALVGLADRAAFLALPQEADAPAPLTGSAQRALLERVYSTAQEVIARLPNFLAVRRVAAFADKPPVNLGAVIMPYQPLDFLGETAATVLYRDGKERVEAQAGAVPAGLVTSGEFGATLKLVLADTRADTRADTGADTRADVKAETRADRRAGARARAPVFARWERVGGRWVAVFSYKVPRGASHYELQYCCTPTGSRKIFDLFTAYHGEITLDPETAVVCA